MVLLVTSDNEQIVVDKEGAERSVLIKNMLEGGIYIDHLRHLRTPADTPRRRG